MDHDDMKQINDVYEKLGIPTDADATSENSSSDWRYSSFGIFVEDGFNFSSNTNKI